MTAIHGEGIYQDGKDYRFWFTDMKHVYFDVAITQSQIDSMYETFGMFATKKENKKKKEKKLWSLHSISRITKVSSTGYSHNPV